MAELFLRPDFAAAIGGENLSACRDPRTLLQWAFAVAGQADAGDVYRDKEGRKTLRFVRGGRSYFLKLHRGIGWREICKNLLQLRLPVLGAGNEYRAVRALQAIGVDTMTIAAYARSGHNPASRQSMIVTEELLDTISLEDYCSDWAHNPPPLKIRLQLIRKLADVSRQMHGAGINHRDYYLCHFHLAKCSLDQPDPRCYLIDLHRAQLRRSVPPRWRVKDLAGLYFSALDSGLTRRDLLRFIRHYSGRGLREALEGYAGLWRRVERRAFRLYRRERGRGPPLVAGQYR